MVKLFGIGASNSDDKWHIEVETSTASEVLEEEIWQVSMDILDTYSDIKIVIPIAWVELEDIDLSINKTVLTIKGKRPTPEFYLEEGTQLKNSECFWGHFTRNVILPENLNTSRIKAIMDNNVLLITIPKIEFDSKTIKIDRLDS